MMLEWATEEKVLLDIKKVIATAWRMNSQQLHAYYKKLREQWPGILPGYLGSTFLAKLDEISAFGTGANTKIWPELLRDADRLLQLIQERRDWDGKRWLQALPGLETRQGKLFGTELGRAFVLALREKLGLHVPEQPLVWHCGTNSVPRPGAGTARRSNAQLHSPDTRKQAGSSSQGPRRSSPQLHSPDTRKQARSSSQEPRRSNPRLYSPDTREQAGSSSQELRRSNNPQLHSPDTRKQAGSSSQESHRLDEIELEKVAAWLMEDTYKPQESRKHKPRHRHFIKLPAGAEIAISACISVCLLSVWLFGQIERNQNFHNIQKLKAVAVTQQQAFAEKRQGADVDEAGHADSGADEGMDAAGRLGSGTDAAVRTGSIDGAGAGSNTDAAGRTGASTDAAGAGKRAGAAGRKEKPQILAQYQEMAKEYPGLFGWLQIPGTQIDLPVMQPFKEKGYYLDHDFTGAASAEGALFADPENSRWPQDANTVIYGHNMKNGHMFGSLGLYESKDYFDAHKEIYFDTIYETGVYEAVAVLKTRILSEGEPGFRYYQFFQYASEEEFQHCLDFVAANQLFGTGSTLRYGDQILMLSTCEYSRENGRLVVVARKVSK